MTRRIKIGQIGIGHNHGEAKMRSACKLNDLFEVTGYAEEDEKWIAQRGGSEVYRKLRRLSVAELLEQSDAVLVETDVPRLTEYAKLCADAGKHIHMDKPASGSLNDFKELIDAAKEKKLVLQLGYMYRYNPAVQKAMQLAKSGSLGRILSVDAQISTFHAKWYKEWLSRFDGGSMYIFGSHLVDIVVSLLGEPDTVASFFRCTDTDGISFPDNTLAVLGYGAALARIYVSSVEVNGWGRRQLTVAGDKATVSILPIENVTAMTYSDLSIATDAYRDMKENIAVPDIPQDCRYDVMMRGFYDYITGRTENPYTYEHEYAVQKTLLRIINGDNAQ